MIVSSTSDTASGRPAASRDVWTEVLCELLRAAKHWDRLHPRRHWDRAHFAGSGAAGVEARA